jgi:hypothetical protein
MPGMPGGVGGGLGGEGIKRAPSGGLPGGGEPGAFGTESTLSNPADTDPKHYQAEYLRRRLRQDLYAIQLGLTGGEDFVERKNTPGQPAGGGGSAAGGGSAPAGEKKGLHSIAKGQDQDQIKQVYSRVRKLAEVVEQGGESDFYQFGKDVRKELKALESVVGKRLPPAGAAAAALDDTPGAAPAGKGGPAKGGPPKGGPPKGGPPLPAKKSAGRPQPQVFGQPRLK